MAGFSLDMAINRTNVGRQMVGDLGNFVGTDLRKQFMFGPQKLAYGPQKFAEGETVAEEITFETVSFTDDITGKTKTFKYNPETHHPPDSTGRMRKKGVNTSDVATQGGVNFFDAAEVVEEEAAPAGPAAPPRQEKPPIPFNPETDADREGQEQDRDQIFNPLTGKELTTDFSQHKNFDKTLMEHRIAQAVDPLMSGRTFGLVPNDPNRVAKEMLMGQNSLIRAYTGPDFGKLVQDHKKMGFGFTEEEAEKLIAKHANEKGIVDSAGLKELFREGKIKEQGGKDGFNMHPSVKENRIEVDRTPEHWADNLLKKVVKKEGDDADRGDLEAKRRAARAGPPLPQDYTKPERTPKQQLDDYAKLKAGTYTGSDTSGGLSSLDRPSIEVEQADKVTRLDGPEAGLTSALKGPSPAKTLAQDLTASITPVTTENLPSITPRAKLQADADKEAAQTKKEEEEAAAIKKAQSKLDPKTIKALKAMEKSANLLSIAKKRFDTGEGSLTKKEERGYQTSRDRLFPSMSQLSPEAYETEYSVSKYMPTREEMNKYEAFRAADDRIDWSEEGETDDFAGTIDTGSPFRQGGPVRLAGGGGLSSLNPPINPGDFVIASDVVSGIGDGSSQFGVERLTDELGVQPRPFSAALGGEVRGPGSGLDDLIQTSVRGKQAARLANQEFVVPRQDVMKIGKGNLKNGQEMLYALMDRVRKQKSGGQQPPRLQGSLAGLMGNMRS